MSDEVRYYKRKFRNLLAPILVMLINRSKKMPQEPWQKFVRKTMHSIHNNPVEFLGEDLPDEHVRREIIEDLFQEFMEQKFHQRQEKL